VRYVLTSILVLGAFGTALYVRGEEPASPAEERTILERATEVSKTPVPGGTELVVRYRFAGSCSRAKLVCRHGGEDRVLASTTDCRRSLSGLAGDGYVREVELAGTLPDGASDVRLILESETGTRVAPVDA